MLCGDDYVTSTACAGYRLLLENCRHVISTFEYYFSILIFGFYYSFLPATKLVCLPRRRTYPPPMLQVGKSSIQSLYRPSQVGTLLSIDVEGASARSFLLTPPARRLFPSPSPFRLTAEGAVSGCTWTQTIYEGKRRNEYRFQEAGLVLSSM